MQQIVDLHIHSKYSRACSKKLDLLNIALWCKYKGIDVVGTGDFTYPAWNKDLNNFLEETEKGIFKIKKSDLPTRFILTTEISCVYKKGGKCRRVHICLLAPSLDAMNKLTKVLDKIGNIKSDGRPILGLDAKKLAELAFNIDSNFMVIPAHAWTPWYSIFGSKSGFDTLEECFEELTPNIYAIETGLSSDPEMNWRLSKLDNITLVSNSDAHSLENLGREANVLDLKNNFSYTDIYNAVKDAKEDVFKYTIEFYPEEGKYHLDGHSSCNIRFTPEESYKHNNICPVCRKPLVLGVSHRIFDLADREIGKRKQKNIPYKSIVPLREILSNVFGKGKNTKTVNTEYFNLIEKGKNEFNILLNLNFEELKEIALPKIVEGIMRMREGNMVIEGGYDGVFGTVKVFEDGGGLSKQRKLL